MLNCKLITAIETWNYEPYIKSSVGETILNKNEYIKAMLENIIGHTLISNIFFLIASVLIILKSADLIIIGIGNYAKKLGLSDAIIGLVIIAVAASSPELISSLTGFAAGSAAIGLAAIFGTNLIHASLAMGTVALVGKKVKIEKNIFTKQKLFMWITLILPFLLAIDGELTRGDGIVLVLLFIVYLIKLWTVEGTLGKLKKNVKLKHIWRDAFVFLGCLVALIISGRILVFSSLQISHYLSVSPYIVSLLVIGIGTTLPDFAIEIKSVLKRRASIGVTDLLGSLVIELVFFLGLVSIFKPIQITMESLNTIVWLVLSITFLMFTMKKREITWKHGLVLLSFFVFFVIVEIVKRII